MAIDFGCNDDSGTNLCNFYCTNIGRYKETEIFSKFTIVFFLFGEASALVLFKATVIHLRIMNSLI